MPAATSHYAAALCPACSRGDHSQRHGQLGCTALVARAPRDFVCACEVRVGPRLLPDLPDAGEEFDDV